MKRVIAGVARTLEFAIAAALALMVVLVFGNVVMRYGFNSGILVSEELSRWLFIWATFLGALIALREHAHMGVDVVVSRLPPAGKKACFVLGHLVMLVIVGMLAKGGWEQVRINWDVAAPTTGWSMAVVHVAPVVFAVLAGLILLVDLARLFTGRMADDELASVAEPEDAAQLREILGPGARP